MLLQGLVLRLADLDLVSTSNIEQADVKGWLLLPYLKGLVGELFQALNQ